MIPEKLELDIVTPERGLVSEAVDELILPGSEGYLGVRPGHAPLLTTLKIGVIEYRKGKETFLVAVSWGFAEVLPDRVSILAEVGERAEDIDLDRAKSAQERAQKLLERPDPDTDLERARVAFEKAKVRVELATRARPQRPGG